MKFLDLSGQKFGKLTVIEFSHIQKNMGRVWKCECSCDARSIVFMPCGRLRFGNAKSCGCLVREIKIENISGKLFGRLLVLDNPPFRKNKSTYWKCQCQCELKTLLDVRDDHLKSGNTRGCGCVNIDMMKYRSGKNSPCWNPNLKQEDRELRKTRRTDKEYRNWRESVFKRDNYTCQITGERIKLFNAHHLNSWDNYPNLRYDINNGITLSVKIHNLFHKLYGRGHNTKEQFEEFKARYESGEFKC